MNISKILFISSVVISLSGAAAVRSDLVDLKVNKLFVPPGYDDNDEIVVVLDGLLPSQCHQVASPEITIIGRTITIKPKARYFASPQCQDNPIPAPFFYEARLGSLPSGVYNISTNQGELQKPLHVQFSLGHPAPDNILYAPVERVAVHKKPGNPTGHHSYEALVDLLFTSTCMRWVGFRPIDEWDPADDVIELLPEVEILSRTDCVNLQRPTTASIDIPSQKAGRYLLHVRSMNGQAFNIPFTVD